MKKAIYLLLLTVFFLSTVSAIEIDGSVSSSTIGKSANIKTINIHETAKANLGIKLPLDFNKNTNLKIAGDFSSSWLVNNSNTVMNANCSQLSLIMSIPLGENSFGSFEMGRFSVKDSTELILNQNLDGVRFLVDAPFIKAHLYGGYSGLLNARSNPMLPIGTVSGLYPFAPSYITADFYTYLPDIYEDKSIGIEFLGAINPMATQENRVYAIARIDGEFLYFIPYTLCSAFEFSNEDRSFGKMANLSFATVEYTIDSYHFGGIAYFASGNINGLANFKQLSVIYADKANSMTYSNLIKAGGFFDSATFNDVRLAADAYAFLSFEQNTTNILFTGIQWDFNVTIPFGQKSKLIFDLNQFIPIKNGQFSTNLEMYLSFGF